MTEQNAEAVYYDAPGVKVTSARFVAGESTYAMRNVSAVKIGVTKPKIFFPMMFAILFTLMALFALPGKAYGMMAVFAVIAAVTWMMVLGRKTVYHAVITTNGGDAKALNNTDLQVIERVVDALSKAIIDRG